MAGTDRTVVSVESVATTSRRCTPIRRVDVIYNAVDFAQGEATTTRGRCARHSGCRNARVAGVIARLTEQKGHRLARRTRDDARAGRRHVLRSAAAIQNDSFVARSRSGCRLAPFPRSWRDLGNLLGAMDVFVMPSLEGRRSLVLAMGAGVPVVATAVAGIPEVVDDGCTGLLVAPGDAPALGVALARVFTDGPLRDRMARDAKASVLPRFGVEKYVASVAGLYDELLGR